MIALGSVNILGRKLMYKHIIWDFDGTLFDSYPAMTQAFKKALEEEGIYETSEKIMSLMKVSMSHLIEYYKMNCKMNDDLLSRFSVFRKPLELELMKPFSNIENVCRTIYLEGGKNYLYTHRGKSSIEFLKKYGMYQYFEGFITKENNFKRKPDPEALLYLIKEYAINPKEAVMIGDRDIDLLAAKNAGIATCHFNYDQLREYEYSDFTINDYSQFFETIKIIH